MRIYGYCGIVLLLLVAFVANNIPAQDPAPLPEIKTVLMGEPTTKSLADFRKTLMTSAEQAYKEGEMTRVEVFKLRVATMNPKVLRAMHQATAEHVLSEGKAKSFSAIDWTKLVEIIKELLPVILQIISLFGASN